MIIIIIIIIIIVIIIIITDRIISLFICYWDSHLVICFMY